MIPCSQDFIDALKAPIKQLFVKIEFYDSQMNLITSFEQDATKYQNFRNGSSNAHFSHYGTLRKVNMKRLGGISVDTTRPVRRSFSFGLGNDDNALTWGENSPVWIANRVKIYTGLKIKDGTIEYVPQGVFVITAPEDTHNMDDAKNVYITGQDKAYLFTGSRGKFVEETTIQKGLNIGQAIRQLAQDGGETMFNFDTITDTIPYDITYHGTDTRWTAMSDLAALVQCDLFYDVNGYLRLQKIVTDFSKEPAEWKYTYGDLKEAFYAGNIRSFDEKNLANHIRVIGGSSQTPTIVYDLIVDETKSYTLSQTIAGTQQFQAGTYTNVQDIADSNDGSIGLSQVGLNVSQTYKAPTDFTTNTTFNNVQMIDDTDYNLLEPIPTAHLALGGYTRIWTDGLFTGQTLYGTSATQYASQTDGSYTLIDNDNTGAFTNLNNFQSFSNMVYEAVVEVPQLPASGSAYAGLVYRTQTWGNTDGHYGYFVGVTPVSSTSANLVWAYNGTTISTTAITASAGSPVTIKVAAVGSTHTVWVSGTQVFSATDTNYTGSGSYGFRVLNCSSTFNDVGVSYCSDATTGNVSGTWTSAPINLSSIKTSGTSLISWVQSASGPVTATISCSLSTDGGNTWGSWTNCTNQGSIPVISNGLNCSNAMIKFMATLTSTDVATTPMVTDLVINIYSQYLTSGTYQSIPFAITTTSVVPDPNTCVISWNATTPVNTSLTVSLNVSTDNGATWTGFNNVFNNQTISQITGVADVSQCLFQFKVQFATSNVSITPTLQDLTIQADAPIWKNSPYSTQKIGDVVYLHNNGSPDPLITTQYQAKWRAKYELMNRLGYAEQLSVELAPNWIHDGGDIIDIEDVENNVTGNYKLVSYELPLIPQIVQANLVKYEQVIQDWEAI